MLMKGSGVKLKYLGRRDNAPLGAVRTQSVNDVGTVTHE